MSCLSIATLQCYTTSFSPKCLSRRTPLSMPPPLPSSSLSILMPKYEQAPNQEQKKLDRTATELELERLSRAVIDSINNRSFQAPKKLVAKNYRADIDELPKTNDYDENEKDFRRVAKENPEYHIDVIDVTPDVDEVSGYAIVYCLLSVRGRPANVRRQSVSVVEWMRKDGSWQYYNATVMRGLDGSDCPGARA